MFCSHCILSTQSNCMLYSCMVQISHVKWTFYRFQNWLKCYPESHIHEFGSNHSLYCASEIHTRTLRSNVSSYWYYRRFHWWRTISNGTQTGKNGFLVSYRSVHFSSFHYLLAICCFICTAFWIRKSTHFKNCLQLKRRFIAIQL